MCRDTSILWACTRLSHLVEDAVRGTFAVFSAAYEEVSSGLTLPLRRWLLKLCVARNRLDLIPALASSSPSTSYLPASSTVPRRQRVVRFAEDRNVTFLYTSDDDEDDDEHNARAASNVEQLVRLMSCGFIT